MHHLSVNYKVCKDNTRFCKGWVKAGVLMKKPFPNDVILDWIDFLTNYFGFS